MNGQAHGLAFATGAGGLPGLPHTVLAAIHAAGMRSCELRGMAGGKQTGQPGNGAIKKVIFAEPPTRPVTRTLLSAHQAKSRT